MKKRTKLILDAVETLSGDVSLVCLGAGLAFKLAKCTKYTKQLNVISITTGIINLSVNLICLIDDHKKSKVTDNAEEVISNAM